MGMMDSKIVVLVLIGIICFLNTPTTAQLKKFKLCVPFEKVTDCLNLGRGDTQVTCVKVIDSTDCALKLIRGEVDFGKFSAEQSIVASYFFLTDGPNRAVTIGETRNEEKVHDEFAYSAVAIARTKSIPSGNLAKEKGLKLCHPGVGNKKSGWSDRVLKELDVAAIDSKDSEQKRRCDEWRSEMENEYVSIAQFWGPSCRPGSWSPDKAVDKKLKDQNPTLCEKCPNKNTCSYGLLQESDPHKAALSCLQQGGDVAYVDQSYAGDFINLINSGDKEWILVCDDLNLGTNVSRCHWSRQPWTSITARGAISKELSPKLLDWLKPTGPRNLSDPEHAARATDGWLKALNNILLDESEVYIGIAEVLVKDHITKGRKLPTLSTEHVCNKPARWCQLEKGELEKCKWIATAALTAGVVPPIECQGAETGQACAALIGHHKADISVTNIDDAHAASMWTPDNSPIELRVGVNKYVETSSEKNPIIIALVAVGSKIRNFTDLEGKKACFPVIGGIAYGAFLSKSMELKELPKECPYPVAVNKYFGDSCVPGANVNASNPKGLCELCQSAGSEKGSKCAANTGNKFYNDTGALLCLHSGGGDVAFLDLQVVRKIFENNLIPGVEPTNFRVLCGPGQAVPVVEGIDGAEKCALATSTPAAALSRVALEPHDWNNLHHVLVSVDYLFGQQDETHPEPSFHMYRPFNNTAGLIFPAGTVGMVNKDSKLPAAEGYMTLQVGVDKPCGSGGYNAATSVSVSSALFTIWVVFITLRSLL